MSMNANEQNALTEKVVAKQPGVFIQTFGCQMNVYDSDKLAKILEDRYRRSSAIEDAELILINTCSVREKPENKLYSLLGKLTQRKRRTPQLLVGVGGCVAQQEGTRLIERHPVVDFVFGTHNLSLVPALIDRCQEGCGPQVAVDYRDEWEELPLGGVGPGPISAFIAISRGCNKNCSYCIVPVTRGPEVSRSVAEVLREVQIAVRRGAREVVLLGQTVNSYGLDLRPPLSFIELIAEVSQIDELRRIRFTSPHPQEVRPDFIDLVADNPKVCRHIHMPLQSGSDRILRLMKRNYRRARYLDIITQLKQRIPDIAITTDLIVGFPGETRADFEDTLAVMRAVEFDSSFSFVYSQRPGTRAAALPGQVPDAEKSARLQELQARQDEISARRLAAWQGRTAEVLFDGFSKADPSLLQGRISQNILVNMESVLPQYAPGDTAVVRISAVGRHTLKGSCEPGAASQPASAA